MEEYLRAFEDIDDTGNDGALHDLIRSIINGQERTKIKLSGHGMLVDMRARTESQGTLLGD